jgi:CheY-like chemotaxis protein
MSRRALVIDDNPVNLKVTTFVTRKAGFLVDTLEAAEGALEHIAANRPDVIITDLHLPGMDGLELTRAVKRVPAFRSIPVILLTADNSQDLEASAREAGCEFLIGKPVDTKLFPGLIAGLLGEHEPATDASSLEGLHIEDLRKEFLASGAAECRALLRQFVAHRLLAPTLDFATIRRALHNWAGVGGTLGFPGITRQARALETLIAIPDPGQRDDVREKLIELLKQFTSAVPAPVNQPAAAPRTETVAVADGGVRVKPLVLVADDDATIRAVIKLSLEAAGFECRLAYDGRLTCAMAHNYRFNAIILDIDMPRMSGFQVLYALRNQWSTRSVPVILLSARREQGDILQAAQLGASDYMTKPFEVGDLLARLSRVIAPRTP